MQVEDSILQFMSRHTHTHTLNCRDLTATHQAANNNYLWVMKIRCSSFSYVAHPLFFSPITVTYFFI